MNIAVCEDEENIRNFLLGSLKEELRCRRLYANVQTYESGEALLEAMKHMTFEIYFLDIFKHRLKASLISSLFNGFTR